MNIRAYREAFAFALFLFVVTLICNATVTLLARQGMISEVQEHLVAVGKTTALMLDAATHETLTEPEQKGSPPYQAIQDKLKAVLRANYDLYYIYTVVEREGKIYFIVDTPPLNAPADKVKLEVRNTSAGVMEEYTDATPLLFETFKQQKPLAEHETYTDEWGTVLAA
jgi:hypothetical protein